MQPNSPVVKKLITAEPDNLQTYILKIWTYRSLIMTLAKRDLKAKYAQTGLGMIWTILQPITGLAIYTLFFQVILNLKTEQPYILFVLTGLICWNLFVNIFTQGSTSLMNAQELIRKLYFPKIILPFSKVITALVELTISVILLIAFLIVFKIPIGVAIVLSPIVILFVILLSLGLALIVSSLTVKNRDLHHIVPYLITFGIWFTPVFYPVTIIPEQYTKFLFLNPLAGLVQLFRTCILSESVISYAGLSLIVSFAIFSIGFFMFKRMEHEIADNI